MNKAIIFTLLLFLSFLPFLSAQTTYEQHTGWDITDTQDNYFAYTMPNGDFCAVWDKTGTPLNTAELFTSKQTTADIKPDKYNYDSQDLFKEAKDAYKEKKDKLLKQKDNLNKKTSKITINGTKYRDYYCYTPETDDKMVKMFNNSITWEWIDEQWTRTENNTFTKEGVEIHALDSNGNVIEQDVSWVEVNGTYKFFAEINNTAYPLSEFGYRIDNDFDFYFEDGRLIEYFEVGVTPFSTTIPKHRVVDFNSFLEKEDNNLTSAKVNAFHNYESLEGIGQCASESLNPWKYFDCIKEIRYFDITFTGEIYDTDPELSYEFNTAGNEIDWMDNRTEGTALGLRLETPVLFMNFNSDNETGGYVQDNSINNNWGNNSGATWNSSCGVTDAGNDLGGCFEFDGVDDYVSSSWDSTTDYPLTLSSWIKTTDTGNNNPVGFFDDDSTSLYQTLVIVSGVVRAASRTVTESGFAVSSTIVNDGEWHLVTGVFSSDIERSIYIDGILEDTDTTEVNYDSTINTFAIGIDKRSTLYNPFNGSIDNVQIFDRALSASEILNLYNGTVNNTDYYGKYANEGNFSSLIFYNSTSTYWNVTQSIADSDGGYGANISDPNLVSYWPLDESFDDLVGGNDGTQSGGVTNATGISSGAMNFDGSNTITVPTIIKTNGTEYTYSVWINKKDAITAYIMGDQQALGSFQISSTSYIYRGQSSPYSFFTLLTESPTLNQWEHLTYIFHENNTLDFYKNGVYRSSTEITLSTALSFTKIGNGYSTSSGLNGQIDEVLIYNRSLDSSEVEDLYKAGLSQHANANVTLQTRTADNYNISDAGLVALWGLNGDANDELGVNNGTYSGTVFNESNGIVGDGAYINSSLSYIDTNFAPAYTTSDDFTYSIWINKDVVEDNYGILSTDCSGNSEIRTGFEADNNNYKFFFRDTAGINTGWNYGSPVQDGNWHNIVFMRDTTSDTFSTYLDGVLDINITDPLTTSIDCSSDSLWIGSQHNSYAYGAIGSYDEVRIYNRSLSAAEIQNLYELGNYHIEWNEWDDEGKAEDGTAKTSSSGGNFMQVRDSLITDDTDVSAYVLNYSITPGNEPAPITELYNTSYQSKAIDITDVTFDGSIPVLIHTEQFNSSKALTTYGALNSFEATKRTGAGQSDLYIQVVVDDSTIVDELVRSFQTKDQKGVTETLPFSFAVANGNHTLSVYGYLIGNGNIELNNINFNIGQFETPEGIDGRGNLTDVNIAFSSTASIAVFNKTITKNTNASTYINFVANVNSTVEQDVFCRIVDGFESPWMGDTVPASGGTVKMQMPFFTEPDNESITNISIECYSSLGTEVEINGRFLEIDMADDNGNPIGYMSESSPLTNITNTINLTEGDTEIIESNITVKNGTQLFISASATIRSLTGEQEPLTYVHVTYTNGTEVCRTNASRYTSGTIGNTPINYLCEVPELDDYHISFHIVVEAGEILELLDEAGTYFENTEIDTTTVNTPPIISINNPAENAVVYGDQYINWTVFESQADSHYINITLTNATGTYLEVGNYPNGAIGSYLLDTTDYSDGVYNLTVIACENDTVDLFCGNDTVSITIAQAPIVAITSPVDSTTYANTILDLTYDVSGFNLDTCWYSTDNGAINSTAVASGATWSNIPTDEGSNTWTVYCEDTMLNMGQDTTTFTIDLPPKPIITSPLDGTEQNLLFQFSMTCTDTIGVDSMWYSWMGAEYIYTTPITLSGVAGNYNIPAYCNDTFGSINVTSTNFDIVGFGSNQTNITGTSVCSSPRFGYNYLNNRKYLVC